MANRTLADEIISIVQSVANNNPPPVECVITKIYEDGYVDATAETNIYKYIKCYGKPTEDNDGVIIYANGIKPVVVSADFSKYYTKSEIDEIIEDLISGQIDLSSYVRKDEVDIVLRNDGCFKLKLDNEV